MVPIGPAAETAAATAPPSKKGEGEGLIKSITAKLMMSFRFPQQSQQTREDSMTNSNKSGKVTRVASRFWIFGNSSNEGPAGSEASSSNRLPQSSSKFVKMSSTFWARRRTRRSLREKIVPIG